MVRGAAIPAAGHVLGQFVLYVAIGLFLATNLRRLGPGRGRLLRTHVGVFGLLLLFVVGAKATLLWTELPPYALPVAAAGIWAAEHLTGRLSLLVNFTLALLVASLVRFDVSVLVVFLATGIAALLALQHRRREGAMVLAGLWGGVAGTVVLLAVRLAARGRFDVVADLARGVESNLLAALAGGAGGGVLAAVLGSMVAVLLGSVPRRRLVDLTDVDQPLLRLMQERAPGSFEHCRAMANLAEIAAAAVGADALLVRVGAYYHDLGKTVDPKLFVENLEPGEASPHDGLDPDGSVESIIGHVTDGTRILREGGVPEPVVEFAYTHHGTSVVEYFWKKCLEQGNPKHLDEDRFRYPGMKPQTRETGILMLVDAIEAASRTIQPPSREGFEGAVYHVVYSKLRQGQLDESGLDLEDLRTIAETLVDTLVSASHGRIRYPWQKQPAESARSASA